MEIGIIGIGRWGHKVAKEYLALTDEGSIDHVYVFDSDASRTTEFQNYTGATVCGSLDEVLDRATGVHICLPNNLHYPIGSKVLNKGVHLLVEKPLTTDHNSAHKLIETAMEHDLILQAGHIYRFSNTIKKLKEFYSAGEFGALYNVNFSWTHLMPYFEGLDILWDLLPHPVDIFNFVTGEWPQGFSGIGKAFRRASLNEVTSLQASSESNTLLSFYFSWLSPIRTRRMAIVGSKLSAVSDVAEQKLTLYHQDGRQEPIEIVANNTIRDEILNFVNCIKTGKNTSNNGMTGAKVVEVIEDAIRRVK